jgi:hypothetical protein
MDGGTNSLNDGGTNYAMTQGAPLDLQPAGDLMFLSGTPTAVAEFYYDGTGLVRSVTGTRSRANTKATRLGGAFTGELFVLVRNTQSGASTLSTIGTGTLLCFKGESGGPWFAGTIAFGVHSSCTRKNGIQNGPVVWSIYTSVDAFPSIGVTILVKQTKQSPDYSNHPHSL